MALILIVDDEADVRWSIRNKLRGESYQFAEAESGEAALEFVRHKIPDLVLLDLRMSPMDGFETMTQLLRMEKDLPVLFLTGTDQARTAVQAMQQGAVDYLVKPIDEAELRLVVRRCLDDSRRRRELEHWRQQHFIPSVSLIGSSDRMKALTELIRTVAPKDVSVLIQGESGTGKQIVAEMLHRLSARNSRPFVTIDCGSVPETLMETELFGHEKGAFTGAVDKRLGKLEIAKGGTLFLDEIGNLPLSLQAKLLRALEKGEFERVGGTRSIHADVRLISATNVDLVESVNKGQFRGDLYYRIHVMRIDLPPLREHPEDIEELTEYFLKYFNSKHQAHVESVSAECRERFLHYHWPGNVRQLRNMLEHAILLADKEIRMEHLPNEILQDGTEEKELEATEGTGLRLETLEEQSLKKALERHQGNRKQTAEELGISLRTLYYWLKRYGINL